MTEKKERPLSEMTGGVLFFLGCMNVNGVSFHEFVTVATVFYDKRCFSYQMRFAAFEERVWEHTVAIVCDIH